MKKCAFRYLPHVLVVALLVIGCSDRNSDYSPIPFDSLQWKNGDRYLRGRMTEELIDDSILIHKTSSEVERLLGKPDITDSIGFTYLVNNGNTGPFGLGGPWLFTFVVRLDSKNQQVTEVWCRD